VLSVGHSPSFWYILDILIIHRHLRVV
jgi:hypothetical protein